MREISGTCRNYISALKRLSVNFKHEKCSQKLAITYNAFSAVSADREGIVPVSELLYNHLK